MKNIILINGTIGVGKSTVSHMLSSLIEPVAYLDGEWCWKIQPSRENREALLTNLSCLLTNYLHSDAVDNIILDWAVCEEAIIDDLFARLSKEEFHLHKFTLVCTEDVLRARLVYDITAGRRDADVVAESVARMPLFEQMNSEKIHVDVHNDLEVARQIAAKLSAN